jgi:hypothetical protein
MAEYQANVFAVALQTVKQWGELFMHSALGWSVPICKLLQIKYMHAATILAVHRDRVAVVDTIANRSVRAVDVHAALLSAGDTYSVEERATIHKSMGKTRARRAAIASCGFILATISGTRKRISI